MKGSRVPWAPCWVFILLLGLLGCGKQPAPVPSKGTTEQKPIASITPGATRPLPRVESPIKFTSRTDGSGVDFVYYGSPSPELYMTEQNGGGTGLFDYDNDGTLDLFFSNGSHFKKPAESVGATQRLYRATGGFHYQDVTTAAHLTAFGFGMGVAAADFDNDGFGDLFVAGYGRNRLWHNQGDGTFEELPLPDLPNQITWGTSAAFADLDADGFLDLFVVNYVDWHHDDPPCYSQHQGQPVQISCGPMGRNGQADALYQNLGDGRFENVATSAGVAIAADGKGLALAIADLNGDGRLDVYVANDTTRNFLHLNQGGMKFREEGILAGVAFSDEGIGGASMGVACGDYNRDGRFDLFVTNFLNQVKDAFENLGEAGFRPVNSILGLDSAGRSTLSFGIVMSDFDLDGWPDLFVANGHIWNLTSLGLQYEFEMPPHLFRNKHGTRFENVSDSCGDYFHEKWLGRSVATADLDSDGDTDLVVGHLLKPPAILSNDTQREGNSLQLQFIGVRSARQPLGCTVQVTSNDNSRRIAWIPAGGSFQSTSSDRIILATGSDTRVKQVRITWPDGKTETWPDLPTGTFHRLIEGTGSSGR